MQSWRISWRNIKDKKIRSILTTLAIIIGVASTAATVSMVQTTQQWSNSFTEDANGSVDLYVLSKDGVVAERWVQELEGIEGVSSVQGQINLLRPIKAVERSDKADFSASDSVSAHIQIFGVNDLTNSSLELKLVEGKLTDNGLVIDRSLSEHWGLGLGDRIHLEPNQANEETSIRITAIIENTPHLINSGQDLSVEYYPIQAFAPLPVIQRMNESQEQVHEVHVQIKDSYTQDAVKIKLQEAIAADPSLYVQRSVVDTTLVTRGFYDLYQALYVIGGLGLLIGVFIMYSTVYINVTERKREFSIMKAVGYTSLQIKGHILREVILLAFIGTVIGIGLGALLATQLQKLLFQTFENHLTYHMQWTEAFIVSISAGILLPIIAVWSPVSRASEISESYSIRRIEHKRVSSKRYVTLLLGILFIVCGVLTQHMISFLPMFLGIALLLPNLFHIVHWFIKPLNYLLFGREGRTASKQVSRNFKRTTMAASILSFGVTMLVYIGSLGMSMQMSIEQLIDKSGVLVEYANTITKQQEHELRRMEGVRSVTSYASYNMPWILANSTRILQLKSVKERTNEPVKSGFHDTRGEFKYVKLLERPNSILLDEDLFEEWGGKIGESILLETPNGNRELTVVGKAELMFNGNNGYVREHTFTSTIGLPYHNAAYIQTDNPTALKQSLLVRNQGEIHGVTTMNDVLHHSQRQLNETFGIFELIVYMSIVVAGIGITNSMFMNMMEHIREIGTFRAVGYNRWQLIKMMLSEAFIIGAVAAVIGTFMGIGAFYLTTQEGITMKLPLTFTVSWWDVLRVSILGISISMLACLLPASRATSFSISRALKYE